MKAEPGILKVEAKKIIKFKFVEADTLKLKSFAVSNIGRGLLQGHLSTTRPWLSISPNSVSIGPSTRTTYTITVAGNALHPGFADKAFINIVTNGGNDRVPVKLSVASFSRRKLYSAIISGFLLVLTPIIVTLIYSPTNYWGEPLFWTAVSMLLLLSVGLSTGYIRRSGR